MRKYEPKRLRRTRRPWEFKKKLAAWAVVIATAAATASFVLAFMDKQTASDVTIAIFTACVTYLVSYAAASATEKVSRNRHGLDADGNPRPSAGEYENTQTQPENEEAKG